LLPYILFEKYIYILALEMASPGNQHCANCIGTLPFPVIGQWAVMDNLLSILVYMYPKLRLSKNYVQFGIDSVENLVVVREIALLTDMVKQTIIYVKCCADSFRLFRCILLRLFDFCLLYLFIYFLLPYKTVNQSINQFVHYGMTKCRPTTRSKKAIQLVRKKACLDDKPKNCA